MFPPRPEASLLDVATSEGLTQFVELVGVAGLTDELAMGGSSLTVFAPTDAAFNALPAEVKEDPAVLNEYLRYHIVGGRRLSTLVAISESMRSGTEAFIGVETSGDTITLLGAEGSEATITKSDLVAFNGILHVIDAVLTPTMPPGPGTVVEVANAAGLTTFAMAVTTAGLEDDLSADGTMFHVLAPSEMAFMDFGDLPAPDVLANILLHHAIVDQVPTASIAEGATFTTAANTMITIPALGTNVGLPTNNGSLTEITEVVLPPTTPETINALAETSSLAAAFAAAPAAVGAAIDPDTLMDDPPVTLFAPVNDAFTSSIAPGMLGMVLQHHIVIGQVTTSSLTDGATLTTLNGDLTVNVDGTDISITDGAGNTANVIESDIRTLSGVIHLIDGLLEPQ